jgi:hypothetical protein
MSVKEVEREICLIFLTHLMRTSDKSLTKTDLVLNIPTFLVMELVAETYRMEAAATFQVSVKESEVNFSWEHER